MFMDTLRWELDEGGAIRRFCTPPAQIETDFDRKALARSEPLEIDLQGRTLRAYATGEGPDVLLVHGWNSRGSHMAPLARVLERDGFRTVVLDAPAHGASRRGDADMSSVVEFAMAVSRVGRTLAPGFSVVGHSMGGLACALAAAGVGIPEGERIDPSKLVLVSAPEGVRSVIDNYCRNRGEPGEADRLARLLEAVFGSRVPDYWIPGVASWIRARMLVVHDRDDEEIPFEEALSVARAASCGLFETRGLGHRKVLAARTVFHAVSGFLSEAVDGPEEVRPGCPGGA